MRKKAHCTTIVHFPLYAKEFCMSRRSLKKIAIYGLLRKKTLSQSYGHSEFALSCMKNNLLCDRYTDCSAKKTLSQSYGHSEFALSCYFLMSVWVANKKHRTCKHVRCILLQRLYRSLKSNLSALSLNLSLDVISLSL